MKKRLLSILTALTLTVSLIPQFPISAGAAGVTNLKVGDYLQMGNYNNAPIIWRCIGYTHEGDPIMFSDQIISIKPFDAATTNATKGSHARDYSSQRANYGSNYWPDSNMRTWLQSAAPAESVDWNGNPPTADKLAVYTGDKGSGGDWQGEDKNNADGYNAYENEAGFLHDFTLKERAAIKKITHDSLLTGVNTTPVDEKSLKTEGTAAHTYNAAISTVMQNYDAAYKEQVEDTMFLLDVKEVHDLVWKNQEDTYAANGGKNIFEKDYYIGTLTKQAAEHVTDNFDKQWGEQGNKTATAGKKWHYWLRSPNAGNAYSVRNVSSGGEVSNSWASVGRDGVRPAFCLNLTSLENIGGKGTKSRPYRIQKEDAYGAAAEPEAKPPTAKADSELIFKGSNEIELIDDSDAKEYLATLPGADEDSASGDPAVKLEYKLDRAGTQYSEWSENIPKAVNGADTYLVHWRLVGNSVYNDYQGEPIRVQVHTNGSIAAWPQWQPPKQATKPEGGVIEYTGEEQALVTEGKVPEGAELQYSLNSGTGYTTNIPKATNAGTYTVYYRAIGGTSGYDSYENSIQVEIKKCQLSGVTDPTAKMDLVYTGEPQELVNLGAVNDKHGAAIAQLNYWTSTDEHNSSTGASGQTLTSPTGTDAGKYYVWYAALTDDPNHASWDSTKYKEITVTIDKAQPEATVTPREGLVYNGEEQQLLQQADVDLQGVELQFSVDDNTHYSENMPKAKSAGQHTVYYKAESSTNYEAIAEDSVTVNIAKSDVDVSAGDVSLTYGSELTLTATVKKTATLSDITFNPVPDKVKFYVDNGTDNPTLLGDAVDVSYDDPTYKDGGTATLTLTYDKYKNKLKPGDNKVYAVYGGSVNLNGGNDETVNVRLDKKALTYTVTATNRPYADVAQPKPNPSTVVAVTFAPTGVESGDEAKIAATANIESSDAASYNSVSLSNIRVLPSGEGSKDGQYYTVAETSRENVNLTTPVVISPVSPENWVKAPIPKTLAFSGSEQELVEAGTVPEGCQMQYSTNGSSYDVAIPKGTSINMYTVYWKVVALENDRGGKNYTDYTATQSTVTAQITDKAAPTVTAPTAKTELTYQPNVQQELITPGSAYGGDAGHPLTMEYSLGSSATWSTEIPKAEHAGSYTVYYRVNGDTDYNGQEAKPIEVTIKKATPVVTKEPQPADDLTYTGNNIVLVKAGEVTGGTIQYALDSDDDSLYSDSLATVVKMQVGTYDVYWRVKGNDDYEDLMPSNNKITVSITSADLTRPTAKTGLKYTGEPQELINVGKVGGTGKFEYTFYYQGEDSSDNWSESVPMGTNAGTYTVKWRVTGDSHYTDAYGTFDVITIDKADWTVSTPPAGKQIKANGEEQELITAGVCDNGGEFKYALEDSPESYSTDIPKASEPNTYTIYYKIEGDTNHNAYGPYNVQTRIVPDTGKELLQLTPPIGKTNLVYTGSEQELVTPGNATGDGKTYTMYYSLTNNGEDWSTTIPTASDADEYTVWYKVDGDDKFDSVEPTSVTAVIAKADIEYTEPTATSEKIYQGEPVALLVAGRISKGEGHFEYSLTQDGAYTADIPTGNEAKEYTVWYKVVSDSDNYNGSSEAKSVSVTLETTDIPPMKLVESETGYTITNVDLSDVSAPYTVLAALYNGNTLVALKTVEVSEEIPNSVDIVTEEEADSAKLFVWNSLGGMQALRDAATARK